MESMGKKARECARYAAKLPTGEKNLILEACADALEQAIDFLIAENKKDMEQLDDSRQSFADRLLLTPDRIRGMAEGLRGVARLDDPVNEILSVKKLPNGLNVGQKRVPIGVVGMIYEARPNVTSDAFALCLKSGNACILRGGSEAIRSNIATVAVLQEIGRASCRERV